MSFYEEIIDHSMDHFGFHSSIGSRHLRLSDDIQSCCRPRSICYLHTILTRISTLCDCVYDCNSDHLLVDTARWLNLPINLLKFRKRGAQDMPTFELLIIIFFIAIIVKISVQLELILIRLKHFHISNDKNMAALVKYAASLDKSVKQIVEMQSSKQVEEDSNETETPQ